MRADLIGFFGVPGGHTSENLASAFMHIVTRLGIKEMVSMITMFIFSYYLFLSNLA